MRAAGDRRCRLPETEDAGRQKMWVTRDRRCAPVETEDVGRHGGQLETEDVGG
jgi:hypothetical protein